VCGVQKIPYIILCQAYRNQHMMIFVTKMGLPGFGHPVESYGFQCVLSTSE